MHTFNLPQKNAYIVMPSTVRMLTACIQIGSLPLNKTLKQWHQMKFDKFGLFTKMMLKLPGS